MIELEWFTNEEATRASERPGDAALAEVLTHAIRSAPTAERHEPVAILAMDGATVAGQIFLTYGCVTDNGVPMRVAAAQALATDPAFRGQGIGTRLISETRKLQIPCVYSGISSSALPLYLKLGFRFVDQAPIYRVPVSAPSLVREWRSRYYDSAARPLGPFGALAEVGSLRRNSRHAGRRRWHTVPTPEAIADLPRFDDIRYRRFQVPRPRERLRASLEGRVAGQRAFVLEHTDLGREDRRLLTIQVKTAVVRLPGTRRCAQFSDGHVVEVYPPVLDMEIASDLIAYLAMQAKHWGLGALSIHAMTPALEQACQALGAKTWWGRNTAVEPFGLPADRAQAMRNPDNWWCWATNEDDFEEAAGSRKVDREH